MPLNMYPDSVTTDENVKSPTIGESPWYKGVLYVYQHFVTPWTKNSIEENVLHKVLDPLSVAMGAIVDTVRSTFLNIVFHSSGCALRAHDVGAVVAKQE